MIAAAVYLLHGGLEAALAFGRKGVALLCGCDGSKVAQTFADLPESVQCFATARTMRDVIADIPSKPAGEPFLPPCVEQASHVKTGFVL